ncbi:MAG: helix-turn-helix domain-containing protein [Acetatifactor sp.]|nr:helix-turn-helix domain-containing protein [Acetatifactor sp.]MDE7354658.1 helix-turn-helix domain-containing protein [Acetatifactor sp.]
MSHFSETLKQLRHKKGMGQKQLSSYLHCSVGTISNYESGTHCPDLDTLVKLADFYEVSVDYLLGRTSYPYLSDIASQTISGRYTIDRLLHLLEHLSEKDKAFLAYGLILLEKLRSPGQDS